MIDNHHNMRWGSGVTLETSFGNWVRRRRKALDLTRNDLAQRVGCSPSLIFKIETDERRPSRQIAELLAAQLEIPPDQREMFLKVARQERAALRMGDPTALPQPAYAPHQQTQLTFATPAPENDSSRERRGVPTSLLPVFPTLFIGREHEMDIILRQFLDPACRLLTLTGPGGVGKTRLAVEVARRLEATFTDGVYFLPMAGVDLPESIVAEIANALGLSFSGPADPKMQVIQALHQKNALIVFDNMEHLVEGSAILGEILLHAPGLRMLLTSREPIYLQWEWIFEVQGLPVPETARPEMFESNSALMLFLQRMRQAAPQTTLKIESASPDARAVLQICKMVDGLPLAIELAASWARVMSPGEIAAELARGLDLLETRLQDVPTRHRSIRLVFDHSWKLLTQEERAALMALAVFPGGFTRDAAHKVAGAAVSLLSALVNKSLLRYGKQAGRYDFHELVRQYTLERLGEQPDQEQAAYTRLAEYYADWLADLEMPIKSAQQLPVSARIQMEMANWGAAWRWSARQHRLELLRKMEPCLYWHYEIHGDNTEAVSSITYAVNELHTAGAPASLNDDFQKAAFALLVDQLGWFEFRTGNVERAAALFTESQQIVQGMAEPDHEVLYYIYINWGYMALVTGNFENSARLTQISLEHARALGGQWHAAIAINILGIIEYQLGHLEEADRQLSGSLHLWREVGDPRGLVFCMLYLSAAVLALGDYDRVEETVRESNAIAQQKGDRWAHAFGLDLLGHVAAARGEAQCAVESFRQSLALSQEIGDQWAATLALIHLGDAQLALNDRAGAWQLFRKAYENAQQARWLSTILEVLVAALAADDRQLDETHLAIALAVQSNPAANLPTRQRALRLNDRLAAVLTPQQITAAQYQAQQKTAEEWARSFFRGRGAEGWTYLESGD